MGAPLLGLPKSILYKILVTYVRYLFKEYARTAKSETDNKRNIHGNIFLKVLCISYYTLLLLLDLLKVPKTSKKIISQLILHFTQ